MKEVKEYVIPVLNHNVLYKKTLAWLNAIDLDEGYENENERLEFELELAKNNSIEDSTSELKRDKINNVRNIEIENALEIEDNSFKSDWRLKRIKFDRNETEDVNLSQQTFQAPTKTDNHYVRFNGSLFANRFKRNSKIGDDTDHLPTELMEIHKSNSLNENNSCSKLQKNRWGNQTVQDEDRNPAKDGLRDYNERPIYDSDLNKSKDTWKHNLAKEEAEDLIFLDKSRNLNNINKIMFNSKIENDNKNLGDGVLNNFKHSNGNLLEPKGIINKFNGDRLDSDFTLNKKNELNNQNFDNKQQNNEKGFSEYNPSWHQAKPFKPDPNPTNYQSKPYNSSIYNLSTYVNPYNPNLNNNFNNLQQPSQMNPVLHYPTPNQIIYRPSIPLVNHVSNPNYGHMKIDNSVNGINPVNMIHPTLNTQLPIQQSQFGPNQGYIQHQIPPYNVSHFNDKNLRSDFQQQQNLRSYPVRSYRPRPRPSHFRKTYEDQKSNISLGIKRKFEQKVENINLGDSSVDENI